MTLSSESAGDSAAPRLQITPGMRRFLDYPKFHGPTRMLILEAKYFFEGSWRRAAESLGWEVASVPSAIVGGLTRDDIQQLFTTLGSFKPDFLLASNYAGMDAMGLFARFFEDAKIPYVSWFTDTPRMILYERVVHCSYYSVAATWERHYAKHLTELGFQHVHCMPLATDPALFCGAPMPVGLRGVAFVGTSMREQVEEAWEKLAGQPEAVSAIRKAFAEGRVTRDAFAGGIESILGTELVLGLDRSARRNVELCLNYEATRCMRAGLVKRLEPCAVEVRGDPGWREITPRSDGPVGYFDDLAGYYRSTTVNLNTTSLQMKSAVNQRVFDCPAAGGFLITDRQGDLAELFDPESETVTYADLDELEDKTAYYLEHPDQRLPIILRAQRRIAAQHTHRHRLEALEKYLRERYLMNHSE